MSDQSITLALENREVLGKAVKHLRREGQVPAVIHDHGKESVHVSAPYMAIAKVYQKAGKHHPVNLTVGNKKFMALIRDADFEPRKHQLRHVVFNAIRQNEKVETEVPIVLDGEIPAERASLIVLTHLETVQAEGLPKDLVDSFTVDASTLAEVGDKLTVADIKAATGITILTDPETVIATVEMPKDQIAEANAIAEEAKAAAEEGQVEGEAAPEAEAEANEAPPSEE